MIEYDRKRLQEQQDRKEASDKKAMELINTLTPFEFRQVFYQASKMLHQVCKPCRLLENVDTILEAFREGDL